MPAQDAQRLATILLDTEFRDNITRRWEQGSWRMHVPVIFDKGQEIIAASTTQIHLPREQFSMATSHAVKSLSISCDPIHRFRTRAVLE
jgi:hypothetical protein